MDVYSSSKPAAQPKKEEDMAMVVEALRKEDVLLDVVELTDAMLARCADVP